MWKMHNMESLESAGSEPEASHNGSRDKVIIRHSRSDECAPEGYSNDVNKRPQLETLIERLTLEEPSFCQDFPVNYCCIYSEHAPLFSDQTEEVIPNRCKSLDECSTYGREDIVQRDRMEFATLAQACVKADKLAGQSFKKREESEHREEEDLYQNRLYTKEALTLLNNGSFYTEENNENPKTYFTEGTPLKMSGSTSISDLVILEVDTQSKEIKSGLKSSVPPVDNSVVDVSIALQCITETQEVNPECLRTPMMFSRSSSLDSISSREQPTSNFESSVVSEMSKETSGLMSPSELPDSPSQIVPQCHRITESTNASRDRYTESKKNTIFKPVIKPTDGLVLEDKKSDMGSENLQTIGSTLMDDMEDEYILAACINVGIKCINQKNIVGRTQSESVFSTKNVCKIPSKDVNSVKILDVLDIPYSEVLDCTIEYKTEDTPPNISNSNSQTDLLNLCAHSDDSDTNILAECIKSGMPKVHS
uniref:Uncharacterized protein n=1 Tax=Graphocephala atropunctata TaxID=36148 RepID=A0A1B6LPT5_9HEMI